MLLFVSLLVQLWVLKNKICRSSLKLIQYFWYHENKVYILKIVFISQVHSEYIYILKNEVLLLSSEDPFRVKKKCNGKVCTSFIFIKKIYLVKCIYFRAWQCFSLWKHSVAFTERWETVCAFMQILYKTLCPPLLVLQNSSFVLC